MADNKYLYNKYNGIMLYFSTWEQDWRWRSNFLVAKPAHYVERQQRVALNGESSPWTEVLSPGYTIKGPVDFITCNNNLESGRGEMPLTMLS